MATFNLSEFTSNTFIIKLFHNKLASIMMRTAPLHNQHASCGLDNLLINNFTKMYSK